MRASENIIANIHGRVTQLIEHEGLLRPDATVICALSGGADSVALLAVLTALGYDCVAAHCNFHLRGAESRRDMLHAQAVSAQLGADFCVRDFDVPAQMQATGESVEMACRTLRYRWFGDLADSYGAQAIAVGHHSEDRAETFMLNLMRGAGINGLTSMRPRHGDVVRPLLCLSRPEIEEYLRERALTWVDDSSNASDAHRRNRLRNKILPLMEECFPGAMESILRSVSNLEQARGLYTEIIGLKLKRYVRDNSIDLAALARERQAATILREYLAPLGFSATQVTDILGTPLGSGATFVSADDRYMAEKNRGTLLLSSGKAHNSAPQAFEVNLRRDISSPVTIEVSRQPVTEFSPSGSPDDAYFDVRFVFDGNPRWQLRHWQRGDRMRLYGSGADKLVSDLFGNAKYSAAQKRDCWLLTRDGEIVWIPGLRNSCHGTVGPRTQEFIKLKIKHP